MHWGSWKSNLDSSSNRLINLTSVCMRLLHRQPVPWMLSPSPKLPPAGPRPLKSVGLRLSVIQAAIRVRQTSSTCIEIGRPDNSSTTLSTDVAQEPFLQATGPPDRLPVSILPLNPSHMSKSNARTVNHAGRHSYAFSRPVKIQPRS